MAADAELQRPVMAWTSTDDIAFTSYAAFGQLRFPSDYIVTRQWTMTGTQIKYALEDSSPQSPASTGDFTVPERYLRMYGVQYLFLNKYLPSAHSYIDGPLRGRLQIVDTVPDGWM